MLLAISAVLVLIGINGLLAMSELAMMTSRKARLEADAARGSRNARVALQLASEPTRFLSTVQVGITLVGILAGAFGERALSTPLEDALARMPGLEPYAAGLALAFVVMVITYLSLVFGELVPKRLALAYPESIATLIARPLALVAWLAAWPVRVLSVSTEVITRVLRVKADARDDVSEEDVRALVARAAGTGVFTRKEHEIFDRLLSIGDITVRDLMVPRVDIVWIEATTTPDTLRVLIGTSPYSHFPVCEGNLDRLVGVVHIKDLIAYGLLADANFEVAAVAQEPLYIPETLPALRALDMFQSTRTHIAFVVDEHGGVQGLVTLNTISAALVGDVGRAGESPRPRARSRPDGSWVLDGRLAIADLRRTLGIRDSDRLPSPDASTAAGLVLALLGHIPQQGESVEWMGWRFHIDQVHSNRIHRISAKRSEPARPQE